MKRTVRRFWQQAFAVALIFLPAVSADAAITSLTASSELLTGVVGSPDSSANVAHATVSSAANTFTLRFGLNVNHAGSSLNEQTEEGVGRYTAGFTVGSSGNYDMTVTVHRVGELRRAQTLLGDINCGLDISPLTAPSLILNGLEPGPSLDQLTLAGAAIPRGSGTLALELSEGTVSQTIRLAARPTIDNLSLVFTMRASVTEDDVFGCELAARVGAQNATTILCDNCVYPGIFAPRDINQDGLFVEVTIEDLCGNGGTNPGEQCDLGALNGTAGACCTATCQFRPQNQTCRPAAGDCDLVEVCSGSDGSCPVDLKQPAAQMCRAAAADGCDVAEHCTGADNSCPPDARKGDGTLCRPANPDALGCDFAEVCDGGVCQPDAKAPEGSQCQSDANVCTNERCDASGQCAHVPVTPVGKICDDGLFCNGEDRCNAAGACDAHLAAPCSDVQVCDEVGNACLAVPPILVTNADDAGPGSLRAAMQTASDLPGADTIAFEPAFFSQPRRIRLASALPGIDGDLTILGPGADLLIIDGDNLVRVFTVSDDVTADLSGLTITGGNAGSGAGGGILNEGQLTVAGCHITGNRAAFGGGISSGLSTELIVRNSTIANNTATGSSTGGGIAAVDPTITNSTFSGNAVTGGGGDSGGGLRIGAGTIENSTITDNSAAGPSSAGGLRVGVGTVTLRNTIVAANADNATVPDVAGSVSSGGFNLIGNRGAVTFNGTNDQSGTGAAPLDPLLAELASSGGRTPTHAIRLGSPALDRGSRFGAIADQRGAMRPFDAPGIAGPGDQSDVGAVEMQAIIVTTVDNGGAGSLRQVIADAPANSDILFDPTIFDVPRTIALDSEIGIAKNLIIHGPGANLLMLSGRELNRIFRVVAGGLRVVINDLSIVGGSAADGGGILSESDLTMTGCAIVNNRAPGLAGGGILVRGSVGTFVGCTFSGNTSAFRGGALELESSGGTITNCTFSGNTAAGFGGGGAISLINAVGDRTLAVTDSTIVNNSGVNAGGIRVAAASALATLTVRNSIVASNNGPDLSESPGAGGTTTITSLGHNLTSDGGDLLDHDTDQTGTDPQLGPLQYNGGRTQTHMPLPGSPAIDQANSRGNPTDQRGRTRAFDVPAVPAIPGSDNSDIGAVEVHPAIVINDDNAGTGSLRDIVTGADPGTDVWFDPVFFATERIIFLQSDVLIGTTLTIHGPEAPLRISGSDLGRVFNIASGESVAMADLEILDGRTQFNGGGIASNSDLALTRCTIANGDAGGQGGGLFVQGAVATLIDCTLSGNHADFRGGGLGLDAASATLINSTVSGNTAPSFGGGISLFTSSGNDMLYVTSCTIADNSGADGAGIRIESFPQVSAMASLRNSILSGNTGPNLLTLQATDSSATLTSLGYNLSDDDAGGFLTDNTDQVEVDPLLDTLKNNGGRTFTHALLPGSPAIDQGSSFGVSSDQRGTARPIDDPAVGNASGGDGADIGAFESVPPPPPTATATGTVTRTATASATIIATPTRTSTLPIGVATATATRTGSMGTTPVSTATATRTGSVGTTPVATATVTRTASAATGTPTVTPSGSPSPGTPTVSPSPTPTPPTSSCVGDCDGNGAVAINELVLAVNIALGSRPAAECPAADSSGEGNVTIAELISAVRNALATCPD